ncbi:MAG: PKD domain-containing protein [Thalassotalea sp.]|nr:PKD domain-containing protein [Thalassotalea sp.]
MLTFNIASVEYDFGDGAVNSNNTGTQQGPSHTYLYSGNYTVRLKVTLNNGVSFIQEKDITVTGDAYCFAYGKSNTQWTRNVRVGTVNQASTASPFSYFDNAGFSFKKGEATEIGVKHGSNGPYLANWAVYIDLNNNKSFDDTGELVLSTAATTFDEVIGSVTVPATATEGIARMRVIQSYELDNGSLPACNNVEWGEVEDYAVTITGDLSSANLSKKLLDA